MSEDSKTIELAALLRLDQPLVDLLRRVRELPDSDVELVTLRISHLQSVLDRYLDGELTSLDIENWANAVEVCDEIGVDSMNGGLLKQVIFELANPEICEAITPALAQHLLSRFADATDDQSREP